MAVDEGYTSTGALWAGGAVLTYIEVHDWFQCGRDWLSNEAGAAIERQPDLFLIG